MYETFRPSRICITLLLLVLIPSAFARERGPRVELVCPEPPTPVQMNTKQVLVYELHVTDFDTVPLTLKSLEVFSGEERTHPVFALADDKLAAAMIRVGASMAMSDGAKPAAEDTRKIEPGARAVIFMWIELAADNVPSTLTHRLLFSATSADGKVSDATLENFPVPVRRDALPTLSPPFASGTWVAGDGASNTSSHRRSIFAIYGHLYSPERFAIDWVKVGPNGDSRHDGSARNDNWWDWGEPVLAVADGEITEVVDEYPDNNPRELPPVTLDNIGGNHVILKIAPHRYVTYAHLQQGSIQVKLHDRVRAGGVVARLGNSGNSTGAHLHLQVTDRNSVLESQGVPFVFAGFTYLGPGADYEIKKHISVPWTQSIPPADGVLEFVGKK